MSIQILHPEVVDRIAAGEVLDRPANLIKELVENSIDAGADQIEVEFEGGGRKVCVRDNGGGMDKSDLPLALQRHATSKITQSEDLFQLHSYGFRGEALASIAAVSRLHLTSRPKGSEQGYRIDSEFGQIREPAPVSAREGTEVRTDDLFANVPARLRFLKSEAAEHSQIKNTLRALALAHEDVGFSVRSKGDLIFHWPKNQSFKDRALAVLEVDRLYAGEYELDGIKAEVLVSSPQEVANVNRNMWFFVQDRWIQDRSLTAAVMEAYRNLLMHGEYPTAVVRLSLPPEEVDVNVHPTKSAVKFRDSQGVFRAVSRAIRQVLEASPWLDGLAASAASRYTFQETESVPAASAPQFVQQSLAGSDKEFGRTQYNTKVFPLAEVREAVKTYAPDSVPVAASTPAPSAFRWADLQVIGQLNQTYIVAQGQDALYLVDQHASHERVMFERLMESFKAGNIDVQNLLLPLVFDFSAEEVETLITNREAVEKLGLALERMGPESVAVQAIPSIVTESSVSEALQRLAFELSENRGELAWEKTVAEVFASMACHSVIRAGQTLSPEEMKSLLVQMDQYPLSSFCPHGRPVFIKRRFADIEREFGRIV